SETLPAHGDAVVLAPRATLPSGLIAAAPDSFAAVLRGDPPRPVIPRGATAMAAALPRPAGGGAARFSTGGRDLTIVTEVAGADFAATLDALVDRDLLAAFDGR